MIMCNKWLYLCEILSDYRFYMTVKKQVLLLFCLLPFFILSAQPAKIECIAGKILVTGNIETNSWVVERELLFEEGDTVTTEKLIQSIGRIESTRLFNRAEYFLHPTADATKKNIEIRVSESLYHLPLIYFIPIPILSTNGGSLNRISYGLGLLDRNIAGTAQELYFGAWIGFSPGFEMIYTNPWLGSKQNRFHLQVSLVKTNFENRSKLYNHFNENHFSVGMLVKKYWNSWFYTGIGVEGKHFDLDYPVPLGGGKTFQDSFFAPYLEISFDNRDLKLYSHRGLFTKYKLQKNGVADTDMDNWYMEWDNRYFYQLGVRQAVGFQSFHQATIGTQPIYQQVYIGYEKMVRGYSFSKIGGKNLMINSVEYRFPITDVYYMNLDDPLLGSAGQNVKYGFSGTLFIDQGNFYTDLRDISVDSSLLGFGFGLNFLIPYYEAVRLEAAWNRKLIFEVNLTVGISF